MTGADKVAEQARQHDGEIGRTLTIAPQILIDQFGYRPNDRKIAVIRNPDFGYDQGLRFIPGTTYQVRRAADGRVVFQARISAWRNGAIQESSGDNGWWFDFSDVREPSRYFVYDIERRLRSPTFSIHPWLYRGVLKAALHVFYYQRSGIAKITPFADPCWTDQAAYVGANQDIQAHDVTDPSNPGKVRDLSGGWFDAGDTNKYVTFAGQAVHQLLTAYQDSPRAFTDDSSIPESGNGVPDILDEVKWEIDWLKKMQFADGSVALKVGVKQLGRASPPSADMLPRFYVPACTSATIAAASMFAHASVVFRQFPSLEGYAQDLTLRARNAWKNYSLQNVKQTSCDDGTVLAGHADWSTSDQDAYAVEAAIYLFAATADSSFEDYVKAHYHEMRPYHDIGWSRYQPDQGDALLFLTSLSFAEPSLKNAILDDKRKDMRAGNRIYGFQSEDDLYRSFMHEEQYTWGSNATRANYGNTNLDALAYPILVDDTRPYEERAVETLHYFHGVNPFAMTYMTNMYALGATRSGNEVFHSWFAANGKWSDALLSECGPPPGYIPGGPNAHAARDGVPANLVPPTGQPSQKSYRDWNSGKDASWVVTEPAIYYQSAYVKLLAHFSE